MARRQSFFKEITSLPWPLGVVLAVLCYPAALFIAAAFSTSKYLNGAQGAIMLAWPWFSLLCLIAAGASFARSWKKRALFQTNQSLQQIKALSWSQFELFVGQMFREQGYTVAETPVGADGGVDLVLSREGETAFVQCKQWKSTKVGVAKVREFFGAMSSGGAMAGIFVTSGRYTEQAREFASQHGIELIDGTKLENMVKTNNLNLVHFDSAVLQDETPSCPKCSTIMVKRTARKGPKSGSEFWGCARFPKCRGTLSSK